MIRNYFLEYTKQYVKSNIWMDNQDFMHTKYLHTAQLLPRLEQFQK